MWKITIKNFSIFLKKKRFGFIKIALQEGCPIVPVFAFGETSLYAQDENPVGSYMRTFQDFVMNFTGGITFPSFHGRGVLQVSLQIFHKI